MYLTIDQNDDTGEVSVVVWQGDKELFRMSMQQACQVMLEAHQQQEAAKIKENNAILIAVKALLVENQYIEAIQLARKNLGWSLKTSKLFVDGVRDAMRDAERDKINHK